MRRKLRWAVGEKYPLILFQGKDYSVRMQKKAVFL